MPDPIRTILATDCGSTTTKAILIEQQDGAYRLVTRGEAPTTVEAPFHDVTVGVTIRVASRISTHRGARKMKTIMTDKGLLIPKDELAQWGEVVVEEKPYQLI